MPSKSGVIFISFFVLLAFIAGIIGVVVLVNLQHDPGLQPDLLTCDDPYTYDPLSKKCLKLMSSVISRRKEFGLELCHEINGSLIEILNDESQKGVAEFMRDTEKDIWLGIIFNTSNGLWYWPFANEIAKYKNWNSHQKDDESMSCAIARHENDYAWTDSDCEVKDEVYVLCEYDPIII